MILRDMMMMTFFEDSFLLSYLNVKCIGCGYVV